MSKIFLTILLIISPCLSMAYEKEVASLSSIAAESIAKAGKKTVAVVDFIDLQGNITELGRFISEELSVDLVRAAKGFEVIDRIHLKTILAEHKISMSGLVDPKTVKQLGQIAGVDAIITGCVTPFGDSIRVTCKVITTDTARVIGAGKGDIAKTKAIEELLARGIEGTEVTTPKATTPPLTTPKAQQSVEVKGFLFELQSCKLSGQNVICSLLVTNKKEDRNLRLGDGTLEMFSLMIRIFDDSGREYSLPNEIQLANKKGRYIESLLVSGVPTKINISFDGVSQDAKSVALFEMKCFCESDGYFTVQFRNIPLTK